MKPIRGGKAIRELLPEEKITITHETMPSVYVNRKGFNIANIKTKISDNSNKFISPLDRVDYDLDGIWKTSVNAAKPRAERVKDMDSFYPKTTDEAHIFLVQDPRFFENESVKNAKKTFGYHETEDITGIDGFIRKLEENKEKLIKENEAHVEEMKLESDKIKAENNMIIEEKIQEINSLYGELPKKQDTMLLRYNIAVENIYVMMYAGKISKSIASVMLKKLAEGPRFHGVSVTTGFSKFDTTTADTNINNSGEELMKHGKKKFEFQIELDNFNKKQTEINKKIVKIEYEIKQLREHNERLDRELNELMKHTDSINHYFTVLEDFYNENQEALQQKGGYQIKSKKNSAKISRSIKRGGYRAKSKKPSIKRGGKRTQKKVNKK